MSDYTPITDQDVEDAWVLAQEHHNDNGDLHERKTFRRWLAAHDAEVRRLAFVEIAKGVRLTDICEAEVRADERLAATDAVVEVRNDFVYNTGGGDSHTLRVIDACIAAARGEGAA